MKRIILNKGREKSLLRKHPWVFSGAIKSEDKNIKSGDIVEVFSANQIWLGRGVYSKSSQIRVRLLTFNENEIIDKQFIENKIENAIKLRENINIQNTNVYRLFYSESDGIPGLIIDKFDNYLVCMFLSTTAEKFKPEIVETLINTLKPSCIYERSDSEVRAKEGLKPFKGVIFGTEPSDLIEVIENGMKILIDIKNGHKTGFYIDQRENREILKNYSNNKEILNCFSYTGGFSISALKGNAKFVTNVDSSEDALKIAQKNIELNGFSEKGFENNIGDVFQVLRKYKEEKREFDVIVLDPPKFAESKIHVEKAARGYKDINMIALQIIRKGGFLFTFSCSGLITTELFHKIVADAALDAKRSVKFIEFLKQGKDHPISSNFPEGLYLKGIVCFVE